MSETPDIVAGGLYATRADTGVYRVSKVLAAGEEYVELRCYAARFLDLPAAVQSATLADGEGDVHGPPYTLLTREGFWEHDPVLIGVEPVQDGEWAEAVAWWTGYTPAD